MKLGSLPPFDEEQQYGRPYQPKYSRIEIHKGMALKRGARRDVI